MIRLLDHNLVGGVKHTVPTMSCVSIAPLDALPPCTLGEAPHWDQANRALIYVDVRESCVHRYFTEEKRQQTLKIEPTASGKTVTFAIPVEGCPELLLVGVGRDIGLVRWRCSDPDKSTTSLRTLAVVDKDKSLNRLNDGKCDFKGRLWAGTLGHETTPGFTVPEEGSLYMFSPNMDYKTTVEKVNLSNGLTWSNDRRTFYYIDTVRFSVDAFDYDEGAGTLSYRRAVVDYKAAGLPNDFPDGMTIDSAGNLWVANYNGAKIINIDPKSGSIIRTIALPIQNATSVAWGGPDYSTLYVTSTRVGLSDEQIEANPDNGRVFAITELKAAGAPPVQAILSAEITSAMP